MTADPKHLPTFSHYMGIDWSGAKTPKRSHSIAVSQCSSGQLQSNRQCSALMAAPTALEHKLSREDVFDILSDAVTSSRRTLVGIDCNFGYCQSVAHAQFYNNITAQKLWHEINTLCQHENNYFAGEVWTSIALAKHFWCEGKQPNWFNAKQLRRVTEQAAADSGLGIPESPFKLIGAKQVGKGGLAGMRLLHHLKTNFADKVAIWPFEASLTDTATLVICEIYPRLFIRYAKYGNQKVRSIKELNTILKRLGTAPYADANAHESDSLNDHLTDAIISSAGLRWFTECMTEMQPLSTYHLPPAATTVEGWIFGIPR